MKSSQPSGRGGPAMRLLGRRATPFVERVVENQSVPQHLVIVVPMEMRQAEREREKAGRLRREIESSCVGRPHDRGESIESRILQAVLGEKRVEAALLANVAEFDSGNV